MTDTPSDQAATPTPFLAGRFALFDTPDGGIHLAYRPDGEPEDHHEQLPADLVGLMRTLKEGGKPPSPMAMMRMLAGMGR